ncbi:glycosyltransferase family 2 protein [Coralloluteibacterium thermophilus]|uniref:Glycosyltransferase family 2 protein n=1 Tax=Coralloluteibacterium thermophilum TaxID=2707049 RepID=A0ABV9NPD3_9GAMM
MSEPSAQGADATERAGAAAAALPVVLVPVDNTLDELDACLAALDRGLPRDARVWLVDDARAEPRLRAVIDAWLARTPLSADYSRRARPCGPVRLIAEAMAACADDVVLIDCDVCVAGQAVPRLAAALAADRGIGTATAWCNAGEVAAWPRIGEINPPPDDADALAEAAAARAPRYPALPGAVPHAVALRHAAVAQAGGLDAETFGSLAAALADLSQRLAGLGWRNVLCDDALVVRGRESGMAEGDAVALAARWPGLTPAVARFLMDDPLRDARAALADALQRQPPPGGQRDLFA